MLGDWCVKSGKPSKKNIYTDSDDDSGCLSPDEDLDDSVGKYKLFALQKITLCIFVTKINRQLATMSPKHATTHYYLTWNWQIKYLCIFQLSEYMFKVQLKIKVDLEICHFKNCTTFSISIYKTISCNMLASLVICTFFFQERLDSDDITGHSIAPFSQTIYQKKKFFNW